MFGVCAVSLLLKTSFACEWQTSAQLGCRAAVTCTPGSELTETEEELRTTALYPHICTGLASPVDVHAAKRADTCGLTSVCFWEHPRMCRGAYIHLLWFLTVR